MVWSSQLPNPLIIGGNGVVGQIIIEDSNGNILGQFDPNELMLRNTNNTGMIRIEPNGESGTGLYPGIYFFASNTSGAYANPAFIQANPDSNNNPLLGINGGPWTDHSGNHNARGLIYLRDNGIDIRNIDTATQATVGGQIQVQDNLVSLGVIDPVTGLTDNTIIMGTTTLTSLLPMTSGTWINLTMLNGWTASPGQARIVGDGMTTLRGTLTPGTRADGTQIATLPAGMAPGRTVTLVAAVLASSNPSVLTRLQVDTSGRVFVFGAASPVISVCIDGTQFDNSQWLA